MGLSIYKSDVNTISDNINIINYKQKNIENVINTINDSVNTLKANCYGTTVSVMCFKLNNLKQQIESVNEYLTKYKQESQQVVDLYYQHCDGLNLDEDTLRNNISILNNKIDIYNNLSKPNKRLVNNATLQLERNQELLNQLLLFGSASSLLLVPVDFLISNMDFESPFNLYDMAPIMTDGLFTTYTTFFKSLQEYVSRAAMSLDDLASLPEVKIWSKIGKCYGYGAAVVITLFQAWNYDWTNNFIGSLSKSTFDFLENIGVVCLSGLASSAASAYVMGLGFSWCVPPVGTIVGAAAGFAAGTLTSLFLDNATICGKSINDWAHTACDWLGSWFS